MPGLELGGDAKWQGFILGLFWPCFEDWHRSSPFGVRDALRGVLQGCSVVFCDAAETGHANCVAGRERPRRVSGRLKAERTGFYKRGCQEKTLLHAPGGEKFSDIELPPTAATREMPEYCSSPSEPFDSFCWSLRRTLWRLEAVGFGQPWFYLRLEAYR